jgi:hypothetical protein
MLNAIGLDAAPGGVRAGRHRLRSTLHAASRAPLHAAPWIALVLALAANDACAAALGSLSASAGLFAVLAALMLVQAWPSYFDGSTWSAVAGLLVAAGGAAMLWRARRRAPAGGGAALVPGFGAATPAPRAGAHRAPPPPDALPPAVGPKRQQAALGAN